MFSQKLSSQTYKRAERFLPENVKRLAFKTELEPHWLSDSSFWYISRTRDGNIYTLVDAERNTQSVAFDHERLAKTLSALLEENVDANDLQLDSLEFPSNNSLRFWREKNFVECDLETYQCRLLEHSETRETELRSPDGQWVAFNKDHNLFLRSTKTNVVTQLTFDGERHNDYGNNDVLKQPHNRGTEPLAALWSPDSSKLLTYQLDTRQVKDMHLVESTPEHLGRAELLSYKLASPGDEHLPLATLLVFDTTGKRLEPNTEPLWCDGWMPFEQEFLWWHDTSEAFFFIRAERANKGMHLYKVDARTGETKHLLSETCDTYGEQTYIDLSADRYPPSIRVLENDIIWWSERDDWGHLYLFDKTTGGLKHQITSGTWQVRQLLYANQDWIYFTAGGREAGRDPYYRHLYRCRLDGSSLTLLTPEDADHTISMSPKGDYFVDTCSRVDTAPRSVLCKANGEVLQTLQEADLGLLRATGWRPPERFSVKARDGVTDLYGLLFLPTDFDKTKSYPIIDDTYPGPFNINTPKSFYITDDDMGWIFWHAQELAEVGFAVVTMDGMGTAYRSKSFRTLAYGKTFGEAGGLADHVTGIEQLASSKPYLDITRVGITGSSGGGYASARAILLFPKFYKVAVSRNGNHDQRFQNVLWSEHYVGLVEGDVYDDQANAHLASRLEGKLMLAYGELDDEVHPMQTLRLIDAFVKANKDVDVLVMPGCGHGFGDHPYFIRKRWDYFVEHLLGLEPPKNYTVGGE